MVKLDSRFDADCTASSQAALPCNPSQISCKHFYINGAEDTKCHKVKVKQQQQNCGEKQQIWSPQKTPFKLESRLYHFDIRQDIQNKGPIKFR